jgi:glycosyltransferase involved in cell wall biosynthesis
MSISVVIPCFNAALTLGETLRSVAVQSRAPAEVLVVDDGSTDDSPAIAREAGAHVLSTGGNRGPSAARNLGIAAATSELVAFVDADDAWAPEHLAVVAGLLDRQAEASLAFSRIEKFVEDASGSGRRRTWWTSPPVGDEIPFDALPLLLGTNPVPQSTVVARRGAILDAGGYDQTMRYSEDYDLWCRLATRARFVASRQVTCHYRVHENQATATGGAASLIHGSWRVRSRLLALLGSEADAGPGPSVRERLRDVYQAELRDAWRMGDVVTFDALVSARALAPDGDRAARRWRPGRLALPAWSTLRSAVRVIRKSAHSASVPD